MGFWDKNWLCFECVGACVCMVPEYRRMYGVRVWTCDSPRESRRRTRPVDDLEDVSQSEIFIL
jgi:hypothetical protein